MISYEVLSDQRIVIIEPSGPLQQKDFENLTEDIDELIERKGNLKG
ncbi:MAG: hypothetical protein ACE5KZ_10950 [Candidatus Scalinduaceae bacterium]